MQEIICVLDKSGSMQSVAGDATHGFNRFIKDQQEIGEANLTLVWFDNTTKIGYEGRLADITPLKTWPNGGMTALLDAIGKAINHVKDRFSKEKPEKVILAILTDGHENASVEFNSDLVAGLIKEHREKYAWDVIFLAADQNAWDTAKHLNISQDNTFTYSSELTSEGFSTYSKKISSIRKTKIV